MPRSRTPGASPREFRPGYLAVRGRGVVVPDGELIAFAGVLADEASRNEDLFKVRVDGTGLHRLTATPQLGESAPDWAPGGRRLVCEVWDYRPLG